MKKLLLVFLLLLPMADAWTLGPGVFIGSDTVTTYRTGDTIEVFNSLHYESSVGAVIINGFVLSLRPDDGVTPYDWDLLKVTNDNITVSGNPTVGGTFRLGGLSGVWIVRGVFGEPEFSIGGPESTFVIPPGNQTIYINLFTDFQTGPRIGTDAAYSKETGDIHVLVSLSDHDGSPIFGQEGNIIVKVLRPDGQTIFAMVPVQETPTQGVYVGRVAFDNGEPGTYPVTVEWADITNGALSIMIEGVPSNLIVPGIILVLSAVGMAIGFMTQSPNPWPKMYGATFQLAGVILALRFPEELGNGNIDLQPILILICFASMMILGWRATAAYLEERKAEQQASEDYV